MKKILCLLLIITSLISAVSCSEYKPQKSTKEEKRVVMTMSLGKEEYEIKYELYRALFLNHKSEVDGGDASVWSGENKQEYIDRINQLIINDASKIFAAIYIADVGDTDFDVYSGKGDKLVEQHIKDSVEGTADIRGFGSYDAYLAYLKSVNLNYSVQDLMLRYYIALDKIGEYYGGTANNDTRQEEDIVYPSCNPSVDEVRNFYYSDKLKRIFYAYFNINSEKVTEALNKLLNVTDNDLEQIKYIINSESATIDNTDFGVFLPGSAFNNALHDELSPHAFALEEGTFSGIISINGIGDPALDGKYILYALPKSEEDFEKYYSQILTAYVENFMGEFLNAHAAALASSAKYEKHYSSVIHNDITM